MCCFPPVYLSLCFFCVVLFFFVVVSTSILWSLPLSLFENLPLCNTHLKRENSSLFSMENMKSTLPEVLSRSFPFMLGRVRVSIFNQLSMILFCTYCPKARCRLSTRASNGCCNPPPPASPSSCFHFPAE
jgi:hypothetical protein